MMATASRTQRSHNLWTNNQTCHPSPGWKTLSERLKIHSASLGHSKHDKTKSSTELATGAKQLFKSAGHSARGIAKRSTTERTKDNDVMVVLSSHPQYCAALLLELVIVKGRLAPHILRRHSQHRKSGKQSNILRLC